MTLTEFLLARIAEDEAMAPHGPPAPWVYATHPAFDGDDDWAMSEHHVRYRRDGYECRVADVWHEDVARHIARHDPARILAECEAKRRIVEDHEWDETPGSPIQRARELRFLAEVYAAHPDYDESWAP